MNINKALKIYQKLKKIDSNFFISGSARRGKKEDLHDLDIIYVGNSIPPIEGSAAFIKGPKIQRVTILGEQVDIYQCDPEYFGAMMLFLTGSQKYNIILRMVAKRKGFKLNQYGLFDRETNKLIASKTEQDIYDALGIKFKPPELRNL